MGARASPHSQLLGIPVCPPEEAPSTNQVTSAGFRREQACRVLQARALDLCHELDIDSEVSVENFETLLATMQMITCELCSNRNHTDCSRI